MAYIINYIYTHTYYDYINVYTRLLYGTQPTFHISTTLIQLYKFDIYLGLCYINTKKTGFYAVECKFDYGFYIFLIL